MNKIGIYVIITFAICSLLLLPTFSSASSNPEFIMHASGVVQYSASDPSTTINKAVSVYGIGWSDSDTTFAAQHFTFVDTDFGHSTAMQSLKIKNPNVRVVGYKEVMMYTYLDDWAEVNSHENWFVHDASGNRIWSTGWNWYLMDVSSAGYRQHWISYVNSKLDSMPGYDGVFADDIWNTIADYMLSSFSSTVPASVISNWHSNMIGFLQYAKANLRSGKILVNNSDEWNGIDYISITDGEMIEGFAHASWGSGASYDRPSIDVLARKCATGKIVWAASGIDGGAATQTQIDAMLKYCYASFLVGMSGSNAYWSWTSMGGAIYYDLYGAFQPIMDTNIGQPTGAYYSSQNVYMRDFTGGKVLFNPSTSSYTVNLGQTYTDLAGNSVTSLTMNPHTGSVLVSVSGGGAVPPPSTGDTFGKTGVGTLADVNSLPTLQVQRFQLTTNAAVSKLTVYVGGQSSTCNIIGVIYADNAGVPTTLVAKTSPTNVAGAVGWHDLVFSSPVSLTAGYYHLGWLSGASTILTTYYDAGGTHTWNTGLQASARFYPTPPNPFVVERQNAYTFSIYATYT